MKETFMVVTGDAYPEGNAGAVRTHAFAKILSESGYSPFIIGMGSSTSFQKGSMTAFHIIRFAMRGKTCFQDSRAGFYSDIM